MPQGKTVREKIKSFARTRALSGSFTIIVLDAQGVD
jgi:hypothetical protein